MRFFIVIAVLVVAGIVASFVYKNKKKRETQEHQNAPPNVYACKECGETDCICQEKANDNES